MTKWCSNRSIYNEDKSGILREAKFEFDDKDWAEVNRHADLPDDARRELESSIYLYLVFCLGAGPTAQQNIKNKFKRLTKITDELSRALDDLSRGDRMVLIHMHLGNPILIKHKAAIADLHGWAAQMGQAWGKQRPGPKSSNRDWLIRGAAMIYNGYSKTPFKDFRNREQFIFELLEIAGVDTTQKPSIKLLIRACRRPNWRIFFRRRNSNN